MLLIPLLNMFQELFGLCVFLFMPLDHSPELPWNDFFIPWEWFNPLTSWLLFPTLIQMETS